MERALELEPGSATAKAAVQRVKALVADRDEKLKARWVNWMGWGAGRGGSGKKGDAREAPRGQCARNVYEKRWGAEVRRAHCPSTRSCRLIPPLFPAHPSPPRVQNEMLGKLKDMGNSLLRHFGMSLDNFAAVKDPVTGSYSISFNNNPGGAAGAPGGARPTSPLPP